MIRWFRQRRELYLRNQQAGSPTPTRPWTFVRFLKLWLVTTLGVLVAARIVPGIHYDTAGGLFAASLLLGLVNAFLRPVLVLLVLPLLLVTLGLFYFVLNALLLWAVGSVVKTFHVDGFWPALWGGLVITLVSWLVGMFAGEGPRVRFERRGPRPPSGGAGPVIDV
jgi:putative membrane protein